MPFPPGTEDFLDHVVLGRRGDRGAVFHLLVAACVADWVLVPRPGYDSCILYFARPRLRHSEWAEKDHLKSAARFCSWGRRTLPHDGSPPSGARVERGWSEGGARVERGWSEGGARVERGWSEGGGNNDTRPLRSHATRAPPGQALGSRQLSLAPAPSKPFAAPPARRKPPPRRLMGAGRRWREQPQPFAGCKRSHHCPRAV